MSKDNLVKFFLLIFISFLNCVDIIVNLYKLCFCTEGIKLPGKKKVYKTKVLSVQLGKTLSFIKFGSVVGCGGGGTLDSSSLILKRPTYQILASCYA